MADIRQSRVYKDNFQRPDEDPLYGNGNWALTDAVWNPMLLSGFRAGAPGRNSDAYWTPQTYDGDDAEAWGLTFGGNASNIAWAIGLQTNVGGSSAANGYRYRWEESTGGTFAILYKVTGGFRTQVAGVAGAPTSGGVIILIRRVGSDIECWDGSSDGTSWALRLTYTDTDYVNNMSLTMGSSDATNATVAWDYFGGGPEDFIPQIYRRVFE